MHFPTRVRVVGHSRLLPWSLLTAVLLALAGCSSVKIAYNNLDLYLLWKANDYFALESEQREQLKVTLDSTTAWHRSEELSRYTAVLMEARERVGGTIGETDVEWLLHAARLRYEALAQYTAPRAAELLRSLSPAQIAHFEATLRRENEAFAAEYVDVAPEVQRQQRLKRTTELMEEWVGSVSQAQRTRMAQLNLGIPLTNALRLADRQRRQRALVALLAQQGTAATLAPGLEAWMIEWDQGRSPEYEAASREARRQTVAMVLELERTLSPAQRAHLQTRFGRYAGELKSLATTRPVRAAALDAAGLLTPTGIH
jgi:hypothetical protein